MIRFVSSVTLMYPARADLAFINLPKKVRQCISMPHVSFRATPSILPRGYSGIVHFVFYLLTGRSNLSRTSIINAEILPKTPRSGGRISNDAEGVEISIY